MTTIFETVKDFFQVNLDNEPKNPLHVGEVMSCWLYLTVMDEAIVYIQIGLNTTTDDQVIKTLKESLDQCRAQAERFKNFMKKEGVHLPPASEQRPDSEPNGVPLGVKLTDDELMNGLSIKTVSAITICASAINQCIRSDVSVLFTQCMLEKMKFGSSLKVLMRKRGWIKVPPYYYPPGLPKQ
ncbi:hypothetical protein GCM10011409_42530 [Lentibacillus populi]|uniref:DUF3231 domain-containing protein n=1 Tax=Lentibacillus populi TaxID=1827502 RepID=A0A9W5U1C0_9BACI|nr:MULTISPECIES: DUF3231 family protein [Bacillaceae]MBT2214912.1 DUF3231 family protein [Virgibacillus dakarensis]GGB60683.1 hypothetical protein GCM10011409_42530 [Lentibacillus populi]